MLRQRLLKQSVLSIAAKRMKHQAELFRGLGLLRAWMWEWHWKLEQRIAAKLENVIVEERVMGECHVSKFYFPTRILTVPFQYTKPC